MFFSPSVVEAGLVPIREVMVCFYFFILMVCFFFFVQMVGDQRP